MWVKGKFVRVEEIPGEGVIAFKRDDTGEELILEVGDRLSIYSGHAPGDRMYNDVSIVRVQVFDSLQSHGPLRDMHSIPFPTEAQWNIISWTDLTNLSDWNRNQWWGELWIVDNDF